MFFQCSSSALCFKGRRVFLRTPVLLVLPAGGQTVWQLLCCSYCDVCGVVAHVAVEMLEHMKFERRLPELHLLTCCSCAQLLVNHAPMMTNFQKLHFGSVRQEHLFSLQEGTQTAPRASSRQGSAIMMSFSTVPFGQILGHPTPVRLRLVRTPCKRWFTVKLCTTGNRNVEHLHIVGLRGLLQNEETESEKWDMPLKLKNYRKA